MANACLLRTCLPTYYLHTVPTCTPLGRGVRRRKGSWKTDPRRALLPRWLCFKTFLAVPGFQGHGGSPCPAPGWDSEANIWTQIDRPNRLWTHEDDITTPSLSSPFFIESSDHGPFPAPCHDRQTMKGMTGGGCERSPSRSAPPRGVDWPPARPRPPRVGVGPLRSRRRARAIDTALLLQRSAAQHPTRAWYRWLRRVASISAGILRVLYYCTLVSTLYERAQGSMDGMGSWTGGRTGESDSSDQAYLSLEPGAGPAHLVLLLRIRIVLWGLTPPEPAKPLRI